MYNFLISEEKWVKVGELELEEKKPYWFKKTNGQIFMGTPFKFNNGASLGLGVAECYSEDGCLRINQKRFHIIKGGFVQPVSTILNHP